ncbi:MAG: hypothetical protein Kow0029_14140 [Candidatus Rifleibacteriota bacterium]
MVYRLSRNRGFNLLLAFSMIFAIFIVPATAEAGILGSVLSAVRPFAKFAGKIAGAVAGAALCAGFVPPLGMLAGGVAGWIVGGIVTGYGTGSLYNLATLGGAAAGAMALASFGPIGYIGGALVGGFLGRTAMKLLKKADNEATGGILFFNNNGSNSSSSVVGGAPALAPEIPAAYDGNIIAPAPVTENTAHIADTTMNADEIRSAEAKYQAAYEAYVNATKANNAKDISEAHNAYMAAYEEYKKLTGKEPAK